MREKNGGRARCLNYADWFLNESRVTYVQVLVGITVLGMSLYCVHVCSGHPQRRGHSQ